MSDIEARLLLARLLSYSDNTLAASEFQYRKVLAAQSDNVSARQGLAEVLARQHQFTEAIALLRALLDRNPSDRSLAKQLGLALSWYGDDSAAVARLAPLYRADPTDREVGLALARIHFRHGEIRPALVIVSHLLPFFPENVELLTEAAFLEAHLGHAATAMTYFRRAEKNSADPEAVRLAFAEQISAWGDFYLIEQIYRDRLKRHPGDMVTYRKLANVLTAEQRYDEAESIHRQLLLQNPSATSALFSIAAVRAEAKDYVAARAWVDRFLDGEPITTEYAVDCQPTRDGGLVIRVAFAHAIDIAGIDHDSHQHLLMIALNGPVVPKGSFPVKQAGIETISISPYRGATRLVVAPVPPTVPPPVIVAGNHVLYIAFAAKTGRKKALQPDENVSLLMDAIKLKVRILEHLEKWDEALRQNEQRLRVPDERLDALLTQGRIYLRLQDQIKAAAYFSEAHQLDPQNIPAHFYALWPEAVLRQDFLDKILASEKDEALNLVQWGQLYAENHCYDQAITCFRVALKYDPDCFPAQLALAETLAYDEQFDASAALFETLDKASPGNRKVLLSWARVLAWSKHYDESLVIFQKMTRLNHRDPLPVMEMARAAAWGKRFDLTRKTYGQLWALPVDRELLDRIKALTTKGAGDSEQLGRMVRRVEDNLEEETPFHAYESFVKQLSDGKHELSVHLRESLKWVAAALHGTYRIQKTAYLESEAKDQAWKGQYPLALKTYQALLAVAPGNQEAVFDKAQVACALGLCDLETGAYKTLIRFDPYNNLARKGLLRQQTRNNLLLSAHYHFWEEAGRGELASIERQRSDLKAILPLTCRYHMWGTGHHWLEKPDRSEDTYRADGFSIGFNGVFGPHLTGTAEWTRKTYADDGIKNSDTGLTHLWWRMDTGARIGAGYERAEELYNDFGIRQGTLSSNWWLGAVIPFSYHLEISGDVRYKRYNDDNQAHQLFLSGEYKFTDHPRVFAIVLAGIYRNTDEKTDFHYEDGRLEDVSHPYWAPQDFLSGKIALEWRHDLAKALFCGAEQHNYTLRLAHGYESGGNQFTSLAGEWTYEFKKHWSAALNGFVQRSQQWDATGMWASLQYQF